MNSNATTQYIVLNQLEIIVITNADEKISNVLTQIRALKGVVTISVTQATRQFTVSEHITKLRLKFLTIARNAKTDLKNLKSSILNIPGVTNAIIKMRNMNTTNTHDSAINKSPSAHVPMNNELAQNNNKL